VGLTTLALRRADGQPCGFGLGATALTQAVVRPPLPAAVEERLRREWSTYQALLQRGRSATRPSSAGLPQVQPQQEAPGSVPGAVGTSQQGGNNRPGTQELQSSQQPVQEQGRAGGSGPVRQGDGQRQMTSMYPRMPHATQPSFAETPDYGAP
jgi:hypothetical protein